MARAPKESNEIPLDARLIFIGASEAVLRATALARLVEEAKQDGGFDYQEFTGDGSAGEWIASVTTSPFLSPRRTVVVRQVLRTAKPDESFEPFMATLRELPEFSQLILVADDEPGDEDKQRRLETVRKRWLALVKELEGHIYVESVDVDAIRTRIKNRLENAGKKMTASGIQNLIEMTGESMTRSIEELDKLILFAGDEDAIRDADVSKLVVASRDYKLYNMVRAIFEAKPAEALRQLRILIDSPAKVADTAFRAILPTIRRDVKTFWQARVLVEAGAQPGTIPPHILELLPKQGRIDADKDWKQANAMRLARKIGFFELTKILELIDTADENLKGGDAGLGEFDVLERMVVEMCDTIDSKMVRA